MAPAATAAATAAGDVLGLDGDDGRGARRDGLGDADVRELLGELAAALRQRLGDGERRRIAPSAASSPPTQRGAHVAPTDDDELDHAVTVVSATNGRDPSRCGRIPPETIPAQMLVSPSAASAPPGAVSGSVRLGDVGRPLPPTRTPTARQAKRLAKPIRSRRLERLLDRGVERADDAVELGLVEGRHAELAAQEHGVLDADREVGPDEPLVAPQEVLVELARRSPPAPASRRSRSAGCAGRASATPS